MSQQKLAMTGIRTRYSNSGSVNGEPGAVPLRSPAMPAVIILVGHHIIVSLFLVYRQNMRLEPVK